MISEGSGVEMTAEAGHDGTSSPLTSREALWI